MKFRSGQSRYYTKVTTPTTNKSRGIYNNLLDFKHVPSLINLSFHEMYCIIIYIAMYFTRTCKM